MHTIQYLFLVFLSLIYLVTAWLISKKLNIETKIETKILSRYKHVNEIHKEAEIYLLVAWIISLFIFFVIKPAAFKVYFIFVWLTVLYIFRAYMEWKFEKKLKRHILSILAAGFFLIIFLGIEFVFTNPVPVKLKTDQVKEITLEHYSDEGSNTITITDKELIKPILSALSDGQYHQIVTHPITPRLEMIIRLKNGKEIVIEEFITRPLSSGDSSVIFKVHTERIFYPRDMMMFSQELGLIFEDFAENPNLLLVEDERDRSEISSKAAGAELYKIIVEPDPEGGGRVTGSGTYSKGQNVTVEAEPEEGFVFAGWQDDRRIVRSFSRKFEFEVSEDLKLSAVFDHLEKAQFEATLPGTFGNSEAVPQLSPDHTHLLGLQNGMLTLNGFPESNLINTFPAEEKHLIRGFKWAPQGDVFAYHTEHEEPGGSGGVYIAKLDGTTEKIAALDWPELCSRQILWSPCGRYLFWNKPFSIYNRETGELLVRKEIDVQYSFVRSPLFSGDGSKLAFTLFKEDGSENLWVLEMRDGTARQVTDAGEGDYPFYWLSDSRLLARVGAIGTGGGTITGLAVVDLETGNRELVGCPPESELTDQHPRRLYIAKGVSPKEDYLIGESRDTAGAESKIFWQDLKSGKREIFLEGETALEGYSLQQVLWINGEQMLLNIRKDSYGIADYDSKGRHLIMKYTRGGECIPVVVNEKNMHLLGIEGGRLYYLESNKTGSHWSCHNIQLKKD